MQVQLQLRRPSDGGVSAPRPFEFLPLDAGRAYWSAKRLKTNYNVFNQILSADQAVRNYQEATNTSPLHHKVRADVAAAVGHNTHAPLQASQLFIQQAGMLLSADDIKEEETMLSPVNKQMLKPVAMPGAFSLAPILQPGTGFPPRPLSSVSTTTSPAMCEGTVSQPPPPAVPVRSPHKSSLLQTHLLTQPQPQPPSRQHQPSTAMLPSASAPPRPMSDLSLMSDLTQFADDEQQQRVSLCTQQSVNELLSLAEFELDNVSVNTFIMDPLASGSGRPPLESAVPPMILAYHHHHQQLLVEAGGSRKISEYLGGSMSSVATVKEIKPSELAQSGELKTETMDEEAGALSLTTMVNPPSSGCDLTDMDLDIGQIYDDVMQFVYDDVDTKYDVLAATLVEKADSSIGGVATEPPVPPLRKRGLSIDRGVDRPLPITPRNPTIIDKIAEKKNELLREREREAERKRVLDEAKRKEREVVEEARRVEREEKERRKQEERERRRQEEEMKRSQKKKEEEERRGRREQSEGSGGGAGLLSQSLFQRLFQRTSARPEEDGTEIDGAASGGEYQV